MWEEIKVVQLKIVPRNFPRGTEDNHENLRIDGVSEET
jgi:hypothetical protein